MLAPLSRTKLGRLVGRFYPDGRSGHVNRSGIMGRSKDFYGEYVFSKIQFYRSRFVGLSGPYQGQVPFLLVTLVEDVQKC